MSENGRFLGAVLVSLACVFAPGQAGYAENFIVEDGEPKAEIVVAEISPRMVSFAALELQYYLEKMSGAKVPIVFEPTHEDYIKIHVGKSKYTDEMGIDDKGLKYGAFRMDTGEDYLVLIGHDFDYHPPKPYATKRSLIDEATEEWDKITDKYTDLKWGSPITGTGFKSWWKPNSSANWISFNEFMENRYGKDNRHVWNPANKEWEREWGKDYYEGLKNGYTPGFWKSDEGGSLNAVYAFLRQLGARWYMPAEIGEVIPELKTIALPSENVVDKPDFAIRYWLWYNYGSFPFEHVMWARRLGMNTPFERLGYVGHAHGLTAVHARKEMQDKHPEYYALDNNGKRITDYRGSGHVCFSSEGFYNETVNFARFMFDVYDAPHVSLWPQDGFRHCQCEECKQLSSSDLVFGFVDRVARELYKTHPDRMVSCGAYTSYARAPESIKQFTPNVAVLIAMGGRPSMDDPVKWEEYHSNIESWKKKLAKANIMRVENNRYHIWGGNILFPVIHPRNMAKDLNYLNGYCLGEANEESQSGGRWAAPGCDHLTLYVNARFLWDADQDIEEVLAEYYEKFYGPAAKEMRAAFDFAEAKYGRRTRSKRRRGKLDPQGVSLPVRIELLELLHTAREVAGDTIYGQRIDVILSEIVPLEKVREEHALLQKEGNPRDDALQVDAYNLNQKDKTTSYKLQMNLWKPGRPDEGTTFSVNWTEKSLVFNIRCEEPDMNSIKLGENIWEGDSIVLLLESPYHSYYQIEVSPDGRIFDADRWGSVVTKWKSMADVKTEKGNDYWAAQITIPVAIVGEEGAEADPMNYVVSSRVKPGQDWFFNVARRRPRKGDGHSLRTTYVLAKGAYEIHAPGEFARLVIK